MISNLNKMELNKVIGQLTKLYTKFLPKDSLPVMLWGAPGIGKSQCFRQVATNLQKTTGKTVHITDVRLLLFNPIDLRGIPVADANKELAIWLKPQIFNMDESPSVINMLILDEISAAPPSVQSAAYQITLDRRIGEHKLPDNCIVVAAGNRVTDKSVAYKMPKALANRLIHFEIDPNLNDWKQWAIPHGIDPRIIGFLNWKETALFQFDPNNDDLAYPTPRSWEMVNKIVSNEEDVMSVTPLIAGTIGMGAAIEFTNYCKLYRNLPNVDLVFTKNCNITIPNEPDILYAMSSSISSKIPSKTKDEIECMYTFIQKMKSEYNFLIVKDCLLDKDARVKLMTCSGWTNWWSPKYYDLLMEEKGVN